MKSKTKEKRCVVVLFAIVMIVQTMLLVYLGTQKEGWHIDEYYSYILSNSYDTDAISNAPEVWNDWIDGENFYEFLTVENGERFAYKTVYQNNAKDAHPPLFYFLLHSLCSLFPGNFSPWIGMTMNIVIMLFSQFVFYKLCRELFGNSIWALIPIMIYGATPIFVNTTLFIRMYSMMTLFTVLLVWQHYRLITNDKNLLYIITCGVITFIGTFTQYYFAIFAFFLAIASCIFFLIKKELKQLFMYSASMLISVILVFIIFPAGITQITGSETNNIGNEVATNILNFSGWGSAIISMTKQALAGMFDGFRKDSLILILSIVLFVIILATLLVFRLKENRRTQNKKKLLSFASILAIIVAATSLTICHITGKFVYVRYLYNLFPLISLILVITVWLLAEKLKLNKNSLLCGIMFLCLLSTFSIAKNNMCEYLFIERTKNDQKIIEQLKDKPLIVLNNGNKSHPTALLRLLFESDQMYMADYKTLPQIDYILNSVDCQNGVVYIVLTDRVWSPGFDGEEVMNNFIKQSNLLETYKKFGECDFSKIYIAYPEK